MTTATTRSTTTGTARWAAFRSALESQRNDCVRQREAALAETVASLPDPVAVQRSATLRRTIEEIDAALARIDAGSYGSCERCGTAIPEERLELRPFAATCVACQAR
ncbi:TraR/DksA family transcriptional regulator [Trujillonella humicola]|uniref:TraR/DksA family transcriptional regulator n=1 Tax=Trujillonella humicola TaxID=3383699 RepID=UPI003906468F